VAELCHIRNDIDLSEYTGTVTDGGDLSVHVDAAMAGTTRGLHCVIDDTTEIYGWKTLAGAFTQVRFRFYLDPNSMTIGDGDSFGICTCYSVAGTVSTVYLGYTIASGYQIVGGWKDDEGGWTWSDWILISDVDHYIEVHSVAETGDGNNDGTGEIWLDGSSEDTVANLGNWGMFDSGLSSMHIGALWTVPASAEGTLYLDELKANDDGGEIGPVPRVPRQPAVVYQVPAIY